MHTPLSDHAKSSDVAYIGNGDKDSILQSVASMVSASGTVTNMGESLNKITASGFVGVSHSGGTAVDGTWHYIIHDPSWEGAVAQGNYEDGYVDLVGKNMPKGFVTADDNKGLIWDDDKQAYNYKGKPVDYSNVYVIDGKIGVFTNKDGSDFYEGTVFGKNNEILMTVKDDNGHFYSYWASAVTDPSATMSTYRLAEYKKDLSVLVENDEKLSRNDIKEVTLDTTQANSATIGLLRNGDTEAGAPVKGAITVTSGGGTGGSGAANDTFVKISNGTANQTFATGSKVEVNGPANAITGIKVNGVDYTIKQGSGVKVEQDAANKTTTITVDGNATTITDTDTTYTAGDGISITDKKINVKLKEGEQNLVVDDKGLSMNTILKGMESIEGTGGIINLKGDNVTVNNAVFNKDGRIQNVANGMENTDAVNYGQLQKVSSVANAGWNVSTNGGTATNVKPGDIVDFAGEDNIVVSNTGKNVVVKLGKDLTGLNSVTTNNAYVTNVDASKGSSVTNVEYVKNQITDAALSAGNGISITDKKINVKLKDGEQNLVVDSNGLSLSTALTGIQSITGVGTGAGSISFADGAIKLNNKVTIDNTGKITGVAAGTADTDAVNVSQLNNVKAEAGKHTTLVAGENVTLDKKETDKGLEYTVNAVDTKYTAGNGITIDAAANNAISVNLKEGEVNLAVDEKGLSLNKGLKGIESVSNGSAKLALSSNPIFGATAELTNGQASVSLMGGSTKINGKVEVRQDGTIGGVTDGRSDKDAVNVSQLKKVSDTANAGWNLSTNGVTTEATNVKPGETVDFSGDKNISVSHDGTKVKVELNKDIDVNSVQTNALNSKYNLSVGTANENGIVPFFVNSNGAFYAANNNFSVDKDGKVIATAGEIGNVVLNNGVYTGHSALRDGELFVGDASGNYSQITTKGAKLGKVTVAEDGKISGVAAGVADTDAVNVGQLKEAVEAGNTDTHIKPGEYGVGADNTVNMDVVDKNGNKVDTVTIKDVAKASDVGDVNNIASDIKNQDGSHTTVVDAVNNLNNKVGDLNYVEGGKGNYVTNGENTTTSIGKLDKALKDVADTAAKHTKVEGGNNITVTNTAKEGEAANYKVELNKDIDVDTVTANTVTTGQTVMNNDGVKVGTDVSLNKDGLKVGDKVSVSATAVTAGQTSINNDGLAVGPNTSLKADELKVDGKTYIDKNGLNANGMQITNVADGKENSDAVNVGQLKESEKTINNRIDGVENQVVNNTNRINKLGSRVNKVGAGAAALAALHPMDFDPDDKLTFSAGYGNYAGENAAAIGAYYRPDEKVMFSVAGTVGNGENMVNAGVSFALDRTNHVSNSRTALAREVIDLRGQLAVMGAKMAKMEKAFGMLDETKTKLFPDVPANHWAYEYIAKLAGNGYIEGYPDGNFGGDRLMTRYEFAAMLYRAIENGAALEEKIIKEFEPELGRIRVDRISGEDGDRDKIERVRVNDTKGERDHYGNKLAK